MAPIIAETVGAHAPLITPVATPVKVGPGGYKFGAYWKYGLPIGIRWLVVDTFLMPLCWRFQSKVRK